MRVVEARSNMMLGSDTGTTSQGQSLCLRVAKMGEPLFINFSRVCVCVCVCVCKGKVTNQITSHSLAGVGSYQVHMHSTKRGVMGA